MGKLMYQGENLTGAPPLLGSLKDVNITSPSNNDAIIYNSTTQKWENGAGGGGSLDIVSKTQAEYDALTPEEKLNPSKIYDITDANLVNADIDDTTTSVGKVWSSSKTSSEISDVQDQVDTNTNDISTLNSAIANRARIKTYTFTCVPTTSSPNFGVYNYWWSEYFNISDIFGVNEGTAVLLSAANLNDFGRMPQVELLQNPTSILRVAVRSVNNTDSIRVVIGIIC